MNVTVAEIAVALGLEAAGATSLSVDRVAEPAEAGPRDLALAMKPEYAAALSAGRARVAMLWHGADWQALGLEAAILSPRPRFSLSGLSRMFDAGQGYEPGRHPTAVVHPTAEVAEDVSIGAFSIVGPGAKIGAGSVIGPHCHVGWDAEIGPGALLHTGARIAARVRIGARFICHQGAVIGSDGFSFVTPEKSGVEKARDTLGQQGETRGQSWARIHSLGAVTIGDDVEIGANTCIDRGTVRDTRIGDGTKIDNMVQIGHNVVISQDCLLCSQTGIAGSTVIGRNVVMGGQCGVGDNLRIGDNVILGGGTKCLASVPSGRVMLGYPATQMDKQVESYKALRRLPRLFADVASLKKAVFKPGESD